MIGTSAQEDKQMLRQAQIAKYINLLYEDAFQDWQKKRHDQLLDIARHALSLQQFRAEQMPTKLSDRRWRAGLSVKCAFELPPRTGRRSIAALEPTCYEASVSFRH